MAVTKVQSTKVSAHATSVTLSYTSTPTNGNLLVIFVATSDTALAAPTGFTKLNSVIASSLYFYTFYKVAGASESNSYVFNTSSSGTARYWGVTATELSGQAATNYINKSSTNHGFGTALTSTAVTPTALNCYPLFAAANGNTVSYSGLTSGYSLDVNTPSLDEANLLFEGPANTNTTTAIAPSFTWGTSVNWATSLVLVAPTNLAASPSSLTFSSPSSANQTSTISGGATPYSINTAPNSAVATASLSSATLTVTPVGAGTTSCVVQDANGATVTVSITVNNPGGNVPSIVQHTSNSGHGTSTTITLSSAPTPGNLLVFMAAVSPTGTTITWPAGVTALDSGTTAYNQTATRVVQSGDGTSWVTTFSQTAYNAITVWEITGQDSSSPINGHSVGANTGPGTAATTPSLTPSESNCLPLAFFSNGNTNTYTGLTTGWTQDETTASTNFASVAVHGPATTTASLSAGLTWNLSTTWDANIVLISPNTATLSASPTSIAMTYNAGSQSVTVTRSGYTGSITAATSDATIASVIGGGNGSPQTFQVLRQLSNGAGGTCTITFTCADGVATSLPVTVYGDLIITSTSNSFQPTGTISIAENLYTGTISCSVANTSVCTVSPTSQTATGSTPVTFTFTPSNTAYGTTIVTFTDGNGVSTSETILVCGPLTITPTTLNVPLNGTATFSATESADPQNIIASSSNNAIATVSATTNGPGNTTFTVTGVATGSCTINVDDTHGGTGTVSITVGGALTVSPATMTFKDPASPSQTATVTGGTTPYSSSSSNVNVATVTGGNGNIVSGSNQVEDALGNFVVANTTTNIFTVSPHGSGTCTITVNDAATPTASGTIAVTVGLALSVAPTSVTIQPGKSATATASNGATPYTVTTSNASIATASISGSKITINAVANGTATITVTDADSETATVAVTVSTPMTVSPTSLSFTGPGAATQNITISGGTSPYLASSQNPLIATESLGGSIVTVTPVAPGSTSILIVDSTQQSVSVPVTVGTTSNTSYNVIFTSPSDSPKQITLAGGSGYTFVNSNINISSFVLSGSVGILKPVSPGTNTITITDTAGDQCVITVTVQTVPGTIPTWTSLQSRQLVKFYDPSNTSNSFSPQINPSQQVNKPNTLRKYVGTTNGTSVIVGGREGPPKEISLSWNAMDAADYESLRVMQYINPLVYVDNNDQGYLGVLVIDSAEQIVGITKKAYIVKASFLVLSPYNGSYTILNQITAPTLSVSSSSNSGGYIVANATLYFCSTAFSPYGESLPSAMFPVTVGTATNTNQFTLSWTTPSSTWYRKLRLYWATTNASSAATFLADVLAGQTQQFTIYTGYFQYSTLNPPTYGTAFTGRFDGGKWTQTT